MSAVYKTVLYAAGKGKTSCDQLIIDTATKMLTINSSTLKSVAMNLYNIKIQQLCHGSRAQLEYSYVYTQG